AQTPPADDQAGVTDGNTEQTGTNNDNDNVASYFASVQISRQQARDEALEVLQLVIDSESAVESAKAEAIADVSRIADEIASEANIETLVKAKGFEDCIAVINDGNANIIVKTESALMQNQVAQIMEIVYEQASISPENIKITEKY
ncbi:MAG: SpoIIIAH-like family protein, partial [Clostridia bacterium]|nr:SpoIIIAH-like family protein [Clostridia bacterium]